MNTRSAMCTCGHLVRGCLTAHKASKSPSDLPLILSQDIVLGNVWNIFYTC